MTKKLLTLQKLTPEHEKLILEKFRSGTTDLDKLTREVFNNPGLSSRHNEGKLIAKFLVKNELNPKKLEIADFTHEQKVFIASEMNNGSNPLNIARIMFNNDGIQRLSKEWRAVQSYVANSGLKVDDKDDIVAEYIAPRSLDTIVNKINRAVGLNLEADKISGKYKQYVEKLQLHLNNSRYKRIMDGYEVRKDRQLFEDQFIRNVWDQIDLTSMELDLVMNICADTVNVEVLRGHINKLNSIFDDIEEGADLKHAFSETVKAKTDELNQTLKRVSDNTKKLQGDRSERIKNHGKSDASFITIVQLAQEEEERKNMLRLAELQRAAISEEANRLESLDQWTCRIMGVSKEEVV